MPPGGRLICAIKCLLSQDQEYIWFRGGNLNCLQDIRHFDFFPNTNAYVTKFDLGLK